jgi:hypothetical protein
LKKAASRKSLVNVLGVVYVHTKTSDGGDLYLTRFAEPYRAHFRIKNWYERKWFMENRIRLKGTSSVYRVPTRKVDGKRLELVVKNCRVGEDVPIDTHALQEFCDAEFNSPWEEFSLVTEMRESHTSRKETKVNTQRPMAIYVPPERMQPWQSGRSKSKINRIRARHPGIDVDILKQYKLIYEWIRGKNLLEILEYIDVDITEFVSDLRNINYRVVEELQGKGYLIADMKPEHIIISEDNIKRIEDAGSARAADDAGERLEVVHQLLNDGDYSVIDYELLQRTPAHEEKVKYSRRHSYLDFQRYRFKPTPVPAHLSFTEIFGVPYIYGHAESTGGHMWVVGKNADLFDYFLPERWRKTPSIRLSNTNEVFYTITKDNIHLVWKTSRVGEMPDEEKDSDGSREIHKHGINSPFEEFAIAHALNQIGIRSVYIRAIYMTGSAKMEASDDLRKYEHHKHILDIEGNPILQENHNYITIRGYFNGSDEWVAEHESALYSPIDLSRAVRNGIINEPSSRDLLESVIQRLRSAGYDGSLLKPSDLLMATDNNGDVMNNSTGEPEIIICDFEYIWKISDNA